jgi:hypothetical protein
MRTIRRISTVNTQRMAADCIVAKGKMTPAAPPPRDFFVLPYQGRAKHPKKSENYGLHAYPLFS